MRTTNNNTKGGRFKYKVTQGCFGYLFKPRVQGVEGKGLEVYLIYNYLEIDHNYEIMYPVIAWGLFFHNMRHL